MRVVNVVDLMALQPPEEHPHGLTDEAFDALFTGDRPVLFDFHAYPYLIHRLTYRRHNHDNLHVRGYKEEGTTTTPFDMAVRNEIDRFHLLRDVVRRVPSMRSRTDLEEYALTKLAEHDRYVREHGDDMPEIVHWKWPGGAEKG